MPNHKGYLSLGGLVEGSVKLTFRLQNALAIID